MFFEQPYVEDPRHQHLVRFEATLSGPGGSLILHVAYRNLVDLTDTYTELRSWAERPP